MAARLAAVAGIVGVVLGGSRARGTADEDSDVDLGLYYRGDLDVPAVRAFAAQLDPAATVSERGGWGPWVDGGAWLVVGGTRVDWVYRDLDRVAASWADCLAGRVESYAQPGHPHGVWSPSYAGELALAVPLADPTGELATWRERLRYPEALSAALLDRALWEAGFSLDTAGSAAARGDVAHVAGCVYRTVGCLVQAVHAGDRCWLVNEKGGVAAAAALPTAPVGFAERVAALLGGLGRTPATLARSLTTARALLADTVAAAAGRAAPEGQVAQNGGQGTAGQSPDGSG